MNQQLQRNQHILIIEMVKLDRRSSTIKLERPNYDPILTESDVGSENLEDYYRKYHQGLENFKRKLQNDSLKKDFGALTNAFEEIYRSGRRLFRRLFRDNEVEREIRNYLADYARMTVSYLKHSPRLVGVIELKAKYITDIIPIECLAIKIPKIDEIRSDNGDDDVTKAAIRILGFSFIIKRFISKFGESQERELNNIPRLPVKYFYDKSLEGANRELAFFRENEKYLNLDGPWPEEYLESIDEYLVRYLFRPDIGFGPAGEFETMKRQLDEVHHLSCHCCTDEDDPDDYYLQLTGSKPITLGSMERWLAKYKDEIEDHLPESKLPEKRPLVFLNACGASRLSHKGMTSFPEYFLDKSQNGNCGFIGSEVGVPDLFAAEFSKEFYSYLLQGFGVGEAIFMVRHDMLREHKNPLGILYTSYGDPYLHVKKPVG